MSKLIRFEISPNSIKSKMRVKLRSWTLDDINDLVSNANNINIVRFLSNGFPHPYTNIDAKSFIESASKDQPTHIFAIDVNRQAVGGIGVHPKSGINAKNAEIGYWLGEPFWGKGIATSAVNQIVEFGFKTYDINRIFAKTFGTNIGSQRVLEKAGFKLEARFEKTLYKNGEFLDELIYAIRC